MPRKRRARTALPWCRDNTAGLIYFVSVATIPDYPIKIGFCAAAMVKRLCELQVGNPNTLIVLTTHPATYAQEQATHAMLAEHCLSGEWFARHDKVLSVLESAQRGSLGELFATAVAA